MTEPTPGPEPTLAALLDELIGRSKESGMRWAGGAHLAAETIDDDIQSFRATILARFGGTESLADRMGLTQDEVRLFAGHSPGQD